MDILSIIDRLVATLGFAIDAMTGTGPADQLQLTRLKKRKLQLRDQISKIEDSFLPDIIA